MATDIHESGEDYLEAILVLQKKNGAARAVDVANHLTGYVEVGDTSFLQLTDKGKRKANEIYSRHVLLTEFLQKIADISAEQAEENACRIEHDIDADVKKGIERWMKENS